MHVTPARPEVVSLAMPTTVMDAVLKLMVDPFAGDEIATLGGVLSNLTVMDAGAVLPARSTAVPTMS